MLRAVPPRSTRERWALLLGRYAERGLGAQLSGRDKRRSAALEFLYGREYGGRGVRGGGGAGSGDGDGERGAGLAPTQLEVPRWLAEVRELFPRETVEVVERHALERYGLSELVTDAQVLAKIEPSLELARAVLSFRHLMKGDVLAEARKLIRRVVDELTRRLEPAVRRAVIGRRHRHRATPLEISANLDARATIRANLRHYDVASKRLVIASPRFVDRVRRHLPWRVILCVDQSGSMASSVIHSAVMAAIFARLPAVDARLVLFDTSVVDLSEQVDDPVEVLLSVQLGGGTDIGQALGYCEGLVQSPRRTVLVLISDFADGASEAALVARVRGLREAGVRLLGLAALDDDAAPSYDEASAARLADEGMEIAALTPDKLGEWLGRVIR
ncbi:MAG: VWA domain-containing protein [Myxococcales bacterium]|nr:VWA domain-containing protein [Myxococcales bacterium]